MDNYSTLIGGIRVAADELERMLSPEVKQLEARRNILLDEIEALEKVARLQASSAEAIKIRNKQQTIRKQARQLYIDMYKIIDGVSL